MGNLVLYCVSGTWVASDLQNVSDAVDTARGVMGAYGTYQTRAIQLTATIAKGAKI
jgi:hypothetical protein